MSSFQVENMSCFNKYCVFYQILLHEANWNKLTVEPFVVKACAHNARVRGCDIISICLVSGGGRNLFLEQGLFYQSRYPGYFSKTLKTHFTDKMDLLTVLFIQINNLTLRIYPYPRFLYLDMAISIFWHSNICWKQAKNGWAFSSQGILNTVEKSGNFRQFNFFSFVF